MLKKKILKKDLKEEYLVMKKKKEILNQKLLMLKLKLNLK